MATKEDLKIWVIEALTAFGGSAHHITVAKHIWDNHQSELNESGDLFYEWQHQMRWAADKLRREGILRPKPKGDLGPWRLVK